MWYNLYLFGPEKPYKNPKGNEGIIINDYFQFITFGEALKYYRMKAKMSQRELARKVGVSVTTSSKWENDLVIPSPSNLRKLEEALHVTLNFVYPSQEKTLCWQVGETSESWLTSLKPRSAPKPNKGKGRIRPMYIRIDSVDDNPLHK